MNDNIICAHEFTLFRGAQLILENASFVIKRGEQVLLSGASGCGKTSLGMALSGELYSRGNLDFNFLASQFIPKVTFVSQYYYFKDKTGLRNFYYQQRYNSYDSENAASIRSILAQNSMPEIQEKYTYLLNELNLSGRIDAPLIQLSSGERKKFQLILALANPSAIMVLDNPYIGLDKDAVIRLNLYLSNLANAGVTLILISDVYELPPFINRIATITLAKQLLMSCAEDFTPPAMGNNPNLALDSLLLNPPIVDFANVVKFEQVSVSYAGNKVLNNINWTVKNGEKWLIRGQNGAGKSTLLSLITGDHPQAYANLIYLFDRRRGSGESVWEIKQRIGFISPELHWNFDQSMTVVDTVVSGFFDTPGLYRKPSSEQIEQANYWLSLVGLDEFAAKLFSQLGNGTQRMILLLRALIKNPPLFIFDEPCQGLDDNQAAQFLALVDNLFANSEHTIIYVSHREDQIPRCINQTLNLERGQQS